MNRNGIGLLAAGSGHNADRSTALITAAQRSDSGAALRRQRHPDPRRHLPAERRAHRRRREISALGQRRRSDVNHGRGRRCSAPVTLFVRESAARIRWWCCCTKARFGHGLGPIPSQAAGRVRRSPLPPSRIMVLTAPTPGSAQTTSTRHVTCSICSTGAAPDRHTCRATATAGRSRCSEARQRADRPFGFSSTVGQPAREDQRTLGGSLRVCYWSADHALRSASGRGAQARSTAAGAPATPHVVANRASAPWLIPPIAGSVSRPIHGGDGERAGLRSANWIWTPGPSTVQLYLADSARRRPCALDPISGPIYAITDHCHAFGACGDALLGLRRVQAS